MALIMTFNRNPDQINTALDRTEHILADLTVRLDRLEVSVERLEASVERNSEQIQALSNQQELTNDAITRTNAAVDRLAGVFARYMDQATIERDYQRTVNQGMSDRLSRLEELPG
jgi:methyl-accepting chemotaxis protein